MKISNYILGAVAIVGGLLLIQVDGPWISGRTRTEYPPQVFGIALLILGVWTLVKEFRRRPLAPFREVHNSNGHCSLIGHWDLAIAHFLTPGSSAPRARGRR